MSSLPVPIDLSRLGGCNEVSTTLSIRSPRWAAQATPSGQAAFRVSGRVAVAASSISRDHVGHKAEPMPSEKRSGSLVLIRHGESLWNQKNLFAGCVDVPLSENGVEEALEAGRRICNIPVDVIFTSGLIRSQMTAMLAMTQHKRNKVPVIMHDDSEEEAIRSRVWSEETAAEIIPVFAAHELNERMYGVLQGLNKKETTKKFGKELVALWRRSYDVPPPGGESLADCAERAVSYFKTQIEPRLKRCENVLIAAHGNSLRAIIMYLDRLTPQEIIDVELSTGVPMLYVSEEGQYRRRGSPLPPSATGVFAVTHELAQYRMMLEKLFPSSI